MSEKYSFPISFQITVDGPLTGKEIEEIKKVVVKELDYLISDVDYISDIVQERIHPQLDSIHIVPFLP